MGIAYLLGLLGATLGNRWPLAGRVLLTFCRREIRSYAEVKKTSQKAPTKTPKEDPGLQDYLTGPHVYSRWPDALVNASEYQFAGPCDCFTGSGEFPILINTRSGSTLITIQ